MELRINGDIRHFEGRDAIFVDDLLEHLELPTVSGMAVAVNDQVVPRSRWRDTEVFDGDRVEIIRATKGG